MDTVIQKMIHACESALLAKKPLLVLRTDELEIVRRLAASDHLVARVYRNTSQIKPDQLFMDASGVTNSINLLATGRQNSDRLQNVFTYSSIESFAKAILDSKAYGYPVGDVSKDYPKLFIVRGQTDGSRGGQGLSNDCVSLLLRYVDRYIQEEDEYSSISSSCVLIYGEQAQLPESLQSYCAIIDEPFPSCDEITQLIQKTMERHGLPALSDEYTLRIANSLTGFRLLDIERLLAYFVRYPEEDGCCVIYNEREVTRLITEEKKQMLKKDQVLELIQSAKIQNSEIGGMEGFKAWLSSQMRSIQDARRFVSETGGMPCKGVLMCGIPGCGKSLAAQEVAAQSALPLVRLDIGKLMGKYVGESEHNLAKALKQAEAMSPCVLWIDEIEKGFSSGDSGDSGSGDVSKRMFGSLLTWLQDCTAPVFIFATANSITGMPKEFFRSGRFDALFSLYMPTFQECVDILAKQMARINKNVVNSSSGTRCLFTANDLEPSNILSLFTAMQSKKYRYMTGADIAKIVNMALRQLWTKDSITYPIKMDVWKNALIKALDQTTVYGDGDDNQNSIAVCYIRLLNNNFSIAAKNPLFMPGDYVVSTTEEGRPKVDVQPLSQERAQALDRYDHTFRNMIAAKMKDLGLSVENSSLRKLIG